MRIKKNGKVIKLTESDLKRIVKRVINEEYSFNVNDPEFGVDGEMMKMDGGTWSYFDPKRNKYTTRQGVYGDHNEDEYSEEWEDHEFDDFTDLKRSDIPNDDWRDLRTRKGFDSMKGDDGKVRIRKNPYKYRRQSGIADIRITEDTDECNTSKDYFIYINKKGDNDGKTKSWKQFWDNVIRKLKDDNEIDTTKEDVCTCLKQNVVYKGQSGKLKIDKMCK